MANTKSLKTIFSITVVNLILSFGSAKSSTFYENLSPKSLRLKKEKLCHLHFFFHDIVSGPNPTAIRVADSPSTNSSSTLFGYIAMIDDPLTMGPEPESKVVEKAQGIYGSASQHELGLLMVLNFVFTEGKYNGSTLSLLGRNAVFFSIREMSIIGGSRAFRFAREYAQAKTHTFDLKTGNVVVDYNVYVLHY